MLTLEMAIQKVRELPPEQQNKVIEFIECIECLEVQSNQQTKNHAPEINSNQEKDFFEIAGIWENKDITTESLRLKAWSRASQ
jgi:hypothetical protein